MQAAGYVVMGHGILDSRPVKAYQRWMDRIPLAMEAHKPVFHLTPADVAIGAHVAAVAACRKDFGRLARRLADATALTLPANLELDVLFHAAISSSALTRANAFLPPS
jgi:chromosome partitioning protein